MKLLLIVALCASAALAQQATGTLRGQVFDELGGAIVGATVVAVDATGKEKTTTTNDQGQFVISGLAPGKYTVRASTTGFASYENAEVNVTTARNQPLNITLKVTIEEQKVTVASDSQALSTEPENNAGAIVLKGSDLEALPDDPDDLAAALQALAGPSAGPNGGQIFVDGFTGGRLPPLASIREIRINSNPFSAEYDRLGMGRIEILTRPGSDRFRGQASFNFNNQSFNSRNPFAPDRPPYLQRQFGGNLGGPISKKKASFFFDFEKRDINDDALIVATILDPNLNITPFSATIPTPNRRTTFSPRFDYQLNASNTLVGRYSYEHQTRIMGVGGFSLATQEFASANTEHQVQFTETSVINKKIVNETRFQFTHEVSDQNASNTIPTIRVQDAFTGGGSQVGLTSNTQDRWELQNNTSFTKGTHAVKAGVRLRHISITDIAPGNFGGTFTFTSIGAYRTTLLGQQQGLTPAQIRAQGGGASQFTINAGNPGSSVSQLDFGGYVQDDWKARKNLTLNFGLRYENQSNISSNFNFAPRVGFAWQANPKTVVRGGFGIFYDRISESLTLTANRLNGVNQQQFIVINPDFFPNVPSIATLTAGAVPITVYELANDIRAPRTMQSVISVEHQLPHNLVASVSYVHANTQHLLRSLAINAPISGVRPLNTINNIFEYESNGRFNQNQLIATVRGALGRKASFNAFYVLAKANSDTDGAGTFPANPYDLSTEYGRSSQDVRHRFVVTGTFRAPWNVSVNPFVIVSSGRPFNVTIGRDLNGDTLFTERPSLAGPNANCAAPNIDCTKYGNFNLSPAPGEAIIPRNFFTAPGSLTTNLRISKTFGFGKENASTASGRQQNGRGGRGGASGGGADKRGGGGGGFGFPGMGGGPGSAPRGGGGGGGGREGGGFGGGGDTGKRYNLTVGINFQNILNHANLGSPVGNLSSGFFGQSVSSGGNFGGFGGGGGACQGACNRRVDLSLRFSF